VNTILFIARFSTPAVFALTFAVLTIAITITRPWTASVFTGLAGVSRTAVAFFFEAKPSAIAVLLTSLLTACFTCEPFTAIASSHRVAAAVSTTDNCTIITCRATNRTAVTASPSQFADTFRCYHVAGSVPRALTRANLLPTRATCITIAAEAGTIHAGAFKVAVLWTRKDGTVATAKAFLAHAQVGGCVALSVERAVVRALSELTAGSLETRVAPAGAIVALTIQGTVQRASIIFATSTHPLVFTSANPTAQSFTASLVHAEAMSRAIKWTYT